MLTDRINDFLNEKDVAIVGLSTDTKAFSRAVEKELLEHEHRVYGVNPKFVVKDNYYPKLADLPQQVKSVIIMTPKGQTLQAVQEAIDNNLEKIWIYQGSDTPEVLNLLESRNKKFIHGRCVLMYLPQVKGIHKFHSVIHNILRIDKNKV
ncbi:MAG: CoA-binding protein [Desulfobulbaceae bacterium]|nr:CoA-binding protein [Candidatus Kapabacteria bacterium]MBS3999129.1 CoA-binding protein [Desulfobulbaceae bacterium]